MRDHVVPLHRHVEVRDEPIVVLRGEKEGGRERKKCRKNRVSGVIRKQLEQVLSATQVLCLNFFKTKFLHKLLPQAINGYIAKL